MRCDALTHNLYTQARVPLELGKYFLVLNLCPSRSPPTSSILAATIEAMSQTAPCVLCLDPLFFNGYCCPSVLVTWLTFWSRRDSCCNSCNGTNPTNIANQSLQKVSCTPMREQTLHITWIERRICRHHSHRIQVGITKGWATSLAKIQTRDRFSQQEQQKYTATFLQSGVAIDIRWHVCGCNCHMMSCPTSKQFSDLVKLPSLQHNV